MIIEEIKIENMIYEIRGKQVMLDSDVAKLFSYETKQLNRQVLRNYERFPQNFCFQLTEEEYLSLRCQNGTLKSKRGNHRKYLPYVFTEYGITMLAGILKSEVAVSASLKIVDTFIAMRRYISSNLLEQKYINNQVLKNTEDIKMLQESFKKFENKNKNTDVFYKGQIYDAYSLMIDILNAAKKEIVIIDNYVNKQILDICAKVIKKIIIITNKYSEYDLKKYQSQYSNIEISVTKEFHDRFIIIDRKELYHCGASFKDLGKKCFAINRIEDDKILRDLLECVKTINK